MTFRGLWGTSHLVGLHCPCPCMCCRNVLTPRCTEPAPRRSQWESHLGWAGVSNVNESRRHSLAEIPTRRGSFSDEQADLMGYLPSRSHVRSSGAPVLPTSSHGATSSYGEGPRGELYSLLQLCFPHLTEIANLKRPFILQPCIRGHSTFYLLPSPFHSSRDHSTPHTSLATTTI